jgi:hypothetical protein
LDGRPVPYHRGAVNHVDPEEDDAVREAEEIRRLRAERDADLTPEQRLERVAALCRQLALIRPVEPR